MSCPNFLPMVTQKTTFHFVKKILIKHLNTLKSSNSFYSSILHETEATNARLADQSGLLKAEIRRLEANQDRKDNIHNLEYLKNIIYKFVTLAPGTERQGLIPVLETMLQVSWIF